MDLMEIEDDTYINTNLTMERLISKVDFQRRKQPSRCRRKSVCLGLLCVVLLAGNIGQIIYYEIISRPASVDPAQASYTLEKLNNTQENRLQRSYDALTAEKKQLEVRLSNLTKEKDQFQQSLTTEKDKFYVSFNNLKNETDQLQASYNNLKEEHNQMQTSFNNMQRSLETLQTNHNDLTARNNQLQTNYNNLQRSNVKLQTTFNQVQGNYSSLKRDSDQLQRSYNTLNISCNLLQTSYKLLWKDKEKFQNSYKIVKSEKEQLQTNYSSLATSQEQLQKKIDKVRRNMVCQTGWRKFDISCYLVTTLEKNWTLSRQDCIAKGADLAIIDSREEQVFVNGLLKSGYNAWIGLSDSLEEGTWVWLDGTPVTIAYWQPGQPNSFNRNQDCGEIVQKEGGGEWNDDGCFAEQLGICEK
ncbi:low affinity immunoglobulin epsilon Fc receptor [Larimichthys crocea]|uniref:low affinity immunoglobulin epsilon Fc receptor n=1 Tax=Larimichthys crocea TaxID=215358 RepID=UPI000F603B06|nr:low affinity immunoglobulin epsilon Fc receptor [Larimichthys crocea]